MMSPLAMVLILPLGCLPNVLAVKFPVIPDIASSYRYPYDGSANNKQRPEWGKANHPRIRWLPNRTGFFDSQGTPRNEENSGLPSARRIMEDVFRHHITNPSRQANRKASSNDCALEFGLLVTFDLAMKSTNDSEAFDIPCDGKLADLVFCPVSGQSICPTQPNNIRMYRNAHQIVSDPKQLFGESYRATINSGTAFLDLGPVYGKSEEETRSLRTFQNGTLIMEDIGYGLFPRDEKGFYNTSPQVFSLIVIFMRFHNQIANKIAEQYPVWSRTHDEDIFHTARNYNIAVYQAIVKEKYIPAVIGDALGAYNGYNPEVDPSIDEFFVSVSFRYGHSKTPHVVRLVDEDFRPIANDPLFLRDVFKAPNAPYPVPHLVERTIGGIEPIVRGMAITASRPFGASYVDDMNVWSKAPSVIDIQRARDVGIPSYNEVRVAVGMAPVISFTELVGQNDTELATILEDLYSSDINKVDAYVGVLFEDPQSPLDLLGPINTLSIRDQFERIRSGDRLWYENIFSKDEVMAFPSLSDIITLVCEGMDKFPNEAFTVHRDIDETIDSGLAGQISLLSNTISVGWTINIMSNAEEDSDDAQSIDLTLIVKEKMQGHGFLGVGWRSKQMHGADLWFCTVNSGSFATLKGSYPDSCSERQTWPAIFSCCLARGARDSPTCVSQSDPAFYELQVVDWCLSNLESSITVNAPVCGDHTKENCFRLSSDEDGQIDLIVAYNLSDQSRPHGLLRRTSSRVNLRTSQIMSEEGGGSLPTGLIAYHAITMMLFWMVLAPLAIFIVRFMKTKTWRLVAHISLMGFVGGLMIPLVIGVEFAVEGVTDKSQEHAVVGLCVTCLIFVMFAAGRIRYLKLEGQPVGRRLALRAYLFHKYSGYIIMLLCWWNCYTGLVRISPEDSYDVPIFGFIKQYIYWPYMALLITIYAVAEIRRIRGQSHVKTIRRLSLWDNGSETAEFYPEMTVEQYLELTRLGSILCVLDGRILDVTDFIDHHPGGKDMFDNVAGSDITDEFTGDREINGFRHTHSRDALIKMKTLAIALLVDDKMNSAASLSGRNLSESLPATVGANQTRHGVFLRAKILHLSFITPYDVSSEENKTALLRLSVPLAKDSKTDSPILPSSCFKFRCVNSYGSTFEAYYTPVHLLGKGRHIGAVGDEEEVYEFLISLNQRGQMWHPSLSWKNGRMLSVRGLSVSQTIIENVTAHNNQRAIIMIAGGTGIAPMLQLIDYYSFQASKSKGGPALFLVWVLRDPEHNYSEWVGLGDREKLCNGKFKWAVIYSSYSSRKSRTDRFSRLRRKSIFTSTTTPQKKLKKHQRHHKSMRSRRSLLAKISFDSSKGLAFYPNSVRSPDLSSSSARMLNISSTSSLDRQAPTSNQFNHQFWHKQATKSVYVKFNQQILKEVLSSIKLCVNGSDPDKGEESKDDLEPEVEEEMPRKEKDSQFLSDGMPVYVSGSVMFESDVREWLSDLGVKGEQANFFYSPNVHLG